MNAGRFEEVALVAGSAAEEKDPGTVSEVSGSGGNSGA